MPTTRGFVSALQVRGDGWVEFTLIAPHAGDALKTLFIPDLDSDLAKAHKRLAGLSLLRDALARSLPVEVEFEDDEKLGEIVEDITLYPRASLSGRQAMRAEEGVIVNVSIGEVGAQSGASPYKDESDLAAVALLREDGGIEQYFLDLQRPDALTAQGMLRLLMEAHRTRRPVRLGIADLLRKQNGRRDNRAGASASSPADFQPFLQVCAYLVLPQADLDYRYAFVERLGQRNESFSPDKAAAAYRVRVLHTTAPGQTPEGDVSDNGSFVPQTLESWVHRDSPLLVCLETALRHGFQVKLGVMEDEIHEVEVVSLLGSASRPVWVRVERCLLPQPPDCLCENTPTTQGPGSAQLGSVPYSVEWKGDAFFVQGIWRFTIRTASQFSLSIDGKSPCCDSREDCAPAAKPARLDKRADFAREPAYESSQYSGAVPSRHCHAYLNGLHAVRLQIMERTCGEPFELLAYRIR